MNQSRSRKINPKKVQRIMQKYQLQRQVRVKKANVQEVSIHSDLITSFANRKVLSEVCHEREHQRIVIQLNVSIPC